MGIVNKLLEPYAGAVLAKIFVLVALILFIQRRPRGLFPQTGRAAESAVVAFARTVRDALQRGSRRRRRCWRCWRPWPIVVPVLNLAGAGLVAVSPLDLRAHAHRQVPVLRDAGAGRRSDLGVLRHPEPRARGVLLARRLRDGHVSDAPDRPAGRLRRSGAARLHGVPELEGAALVLATASTTSGSRS